MILNAPTLWSCHTQLSVQSNASTSDEGRVKRQELVIVGECGMKEVLQEMNHVIRPDGIW